MIIKGQNGRFHQLARNTEKRRHNKLQLFNNNYRLEESKEVVSEKDQIIEDLKNKVQNFEEMCLVNNKNSLILARLFDSGIISADGELIDSNKNQEDM